MTKVIAGVSTKTALESTRQNRNIIGIFTHNRKSVRLHDMVIVMVDSPFDFSSEGGAKPACLPGSCYKPERLVLEDIHFYTITGYGTEHGQNSRMYI